MTHILKLSALINGLNRRRGGGGLLHPMRQILLCCLHLTADGILIDDYRMLHNYTK